MDFLKTGLITINGKTADSLTVEVNEKHDVVCIQEKHIQYDGRFYYFKFNKPAGVISSLSDERDRVDLRDYMTQLPASVFPIGRLDRKTKGLLLFTNDGDFAHRISHPSYFIPKTYKLELDKPITRGDAHRLTAGIVLEDGPVQFEKALLDSHRDMVVTLSEGRNRIVRRTFAHLGYEVVKLKRVSIGPILLGHLPEGDFAALAPHELRAMKEILYSSDQVAA